MRQIKKNDQVQVMAGRDKGKQGKVLKVLTDKDKAIVAGVNRVKRHLKPGARKTAEQGGIIEIEAPIHISNILPYCSKCSKGSRVSIRFVGKSGEFFTTQLDAVNSFGESAPEKIRKIRVCHKCGQAMD